MTKQSTSMWNLPHNIPSRWIYFTSHIYARHLHRQVVLSPHHCSNDAWKCLTHSPWQKEKEADRNREREQMIWIVKCKWGGVTQWRESMMKKKTEKWCVMQVDSVKLQSERWITNDGTEGVLNPMFSQVMESNLLQHIPNPQCAQLKE